MNLIESVPMPSTAWVWGVGLLLVLPLALVFGGLWATTGSRGGPPGHMEPVLIGICALIGLIAAGILFSMSRSAVRIEAGALHLQGALYRRSVALDTIDPSSITLHGAGESRQLMLRVNGIGLPGFTAGWFVDRQRNRIFVAYGSGPWLGFKTRDGVRHIVGTADPARLRDRLLGSAEAAPERSA